MIVIVIALAITIAVPASTAFANSARPTPTTPASTSTSTSDLVLVGSPTDRPLGFELTAGQAEQIAAGIPQIAAELHRHRDAQPSEYTKGSSRWQVSWFDQGPDGYASSRNPFVYFHSIVDQPDCAKTDVGLDQLSSDLQDGKVPNVSWIAPDPCTAGAASACPGAVTPITTTTTSTGTTTIGPITLTTTSVETTTTTSSSTDTVSSDTSTDTTSSTDTSSNPNVAGKGPRHAAGDTSSADAFLAEWIPKIQATPAYKKDGMIVIVSDEAPGVGANADSSACCGKIAYPNSTNAGGPGKPGPGGGRTGALVLSSYAARGTTDPTPLDHYSLLRTVADLFQAPDLGYAQQRKDFDSAVFPSESGGSQAVSTRAGAARAARGRARARRRTARRFRASRATRGRRGS